MWDLIVSVPDYCLYFYFDCDNLDFGNGIWPACCKNYNVGVFYFII